jgi:hypothetical protein
MSHKLEPLKLATQKGPLAISGWFKDNLLLLKCSDLLTAGFNCPCQACHKPQYSAFKETLVNIGKKALAEIIREEFQRTKEISLENAKVALVLQQWLEGIDLGCQIHPLNSNYPALQEIIKSLQQDKVEKLTRSEIYRNGLADFFSIVSALEFFGVDQTVIDGSIHSWCYGNALSRLHKFVEQLESPKPEIDLNLSFEQRWQQFQEDKKYQFVRCYFDLNQDRDTLLTAIKCSPHCEQIIEAIPLGKVAWKRFRKQLQHGRGG